MVHANNYETVSKFVRIMQKKTVDSFSPVWCNVCYGHYVSLSHSYAVPSVYTSGMWSWSRRLGLETWTISSCRDVLCRRAAVIDFIDLYYLLIFVNCVDMSKF